MTTTIPKPDSYSLLKSLNLLSLIGMETIMKVDHQSFALTNNLDEALIKIP